MIIFIILVQVTVVKIRAGSDRRMLVSSQSIRNSFPPQADEAWGQGFGTPTPQTTGATPKREPVKLPKILNYSDML
ncbi:MULTISPECIES: hypothetical protein [unclassified Coleofasciculus]|uniref:hypothetical protein n=1 Tax=unclassified Coleofasciculus TaxID=2692782 RepID=UPI001880058B|nr:MULTISPECIES: hypothetical protein [unclassified Coleofasciculus]MBE9125614.1 hypothetical protein [Coleofasciculus sp. LEGE 07081]MBE9147328.1 hypothetical protein [Coleofasciculus sp. LEGE 07092]